MIKIETEQYKNLLKCFEASCRVQAKKALGSCTIIYSKDGHTYALTNFHVVKDSIDYQEEWDPMLQKDVKKEYKEAVEVLYPRLSGNKVIGYSTVMAEIEIYNMKQDIALLKFKDDIDYPHVDLYEKNKAEEVPILSDLACIGAALGDKPIVTFGNLNGIQIEIDNYEYWMSTAQSIFGNSGGAIFLSEEDKWHFLGIPSRIAVQPMGFSAQAITHI